MMMTMSRGMMMTAAGAHILVSPVRALHCSGMGPVSSSHPSHLRSASQAGRPEQREWQ